eukprot:gene36853-48068_t
MERNIPPLNQIKHLIAGTAGGLVATVSLFPLELVKTRMQVIDGNRLLQYKSIYSAFRTVIQNEGILGLYQGVTPSIIAASGSWGGYFYFYELSKLRKLQWMHGQDHSPTVKLSTSDHLLSGVEAGVLLVFLFNPLWVLKTRMALQGADVEITGKKKYSGLLEGLRVIVREEGVSGLYKGLVPALLLTSHGAIQFATYESMKSYFQNYQRGNTQPAWISVLLGGVSKIIASTITYPYQLVKSRLQQREVFNEELNIRRPKYTGTIDCFLKIWRKDGIVGFFRGAVPNALKVAPSSAVTFLVYEECLKILR